jgi:hypothetical protein
LVLESDPGRRQSPRRFSSLGAINDEAGDVDLSVSIIRIAFAIAAKQVGPVPEIWKRVWTIPASRFGTRKRIASSWWLQRTFASSSKPSSGPSKKFNRGRAAWRVGRPD